MPIIRHCALFGDVTIVVMGAKSALYDCLANNIGLQVTCAFVGYVVNSNTNQQLR